MNFKKAQIGSTITWFIGFLVIVFIVFFFIAASLGKIVVQRTSGQENQIKIANSESFEKKQQQRQLFVLFEKEYENKKAYSITEDFVKIIESGKSPNKDANELKTFKELTKELNKNCENILVIDEKPERKIGRAISSDESYLYEYYNMVDEEYQLSMKKNEIEKSYNFFFPEKPFVLIKYISIKCPEEVEDE